MAFVQVTRYRLGITVPQLRFFYRDGVQLSLTALDRGSSYLANNFYRRLTTYRPDIGIRRDLLGLPKSSDL